MPYQNVIQHWEIAEGLAFSYTSVNYTSYLSIGYGATLLSSYFLLSTWKYIEFVMNEGWPFVFSNLFVPAVETKTFVATNSILTTTKTGAIILMCCSTDVAGTLWLDFNLHTLLLHPTVDVKTAPAVAEFKPWPTNCNLIVKCIKFGSPGVKLRKPDTSSKHIALK